MMAGTDDLREMPHAIDAEQCLLGAILIDRKALDRTRQLVDSGDFYVPSHGRIWSAACQIADSGEIPTAAAMAAYFENDEGLSDVGGGQYLQRLAASTIGTIGAPYWARTIRDLSLRRLLVSICEDVAKEALNPGIEDPAPEIAARAQTTWQTVLERSAAFKFRSFREIAFEVLSNMEQPPDIYPTGFSHLDAAMGGGLYPGKSYGIAARMKVGKTVLAGSVSNNLNRAGVKHLFVAAEMGALEIVRRQMAHELRANPVALMAGNPDQKLFEFAASNAATAPSAAIYADAPGLTFERLRSLVSAAVGAHNVTGVILDYFQLVKGKAKQESDASHYDAVAQWLADIARDLGIWWIVTAQVNQEGNIRGGEALRLACDQVYQLHRDVDENPHNAWLQMRETRYTGYHDVGSETQPSLYFNTRGPMFEDVAPPQEDSELWQRTV